MNDTQHQATRQQNPRKGYMVAIIILLFLCTLIMLFSRNKMVKEHAAALDEKQQIIDSIATDRVYLKAHFDAATAKIDMLMTKNVRLTDSLEANKTAIADLRTKVTNILSNAAATRNELIKARNMIFLLNYNAGAYERYIDAFEKENAALTDEKDYLTKERDETVESNIALRMAGSILHASNVRMELLHIRNNGKEQETTKARKADGLRITFDIDENRIAETGTKEIYVIIKAPIGDVLYSQANGSGMMTTMDSNKIKFSLLTQVPITKGQPVKDVVVTWQQTEPYAKGVYRAELYNQGHKIGSGKAELK